MSLEQDTELTGLEELVNSVPCLVYIFDLVERCTVYTNRQVAVELGFSADDISALGPELLISLMHPDDLAGVSDLFSRWTHAQDHENLSSEYRLRDSAGHWHSFVGRDRVFRRDAAGAVTHIVGVALDVTVERGADRVGGDSRRMLDTLMNNLPGMAYRCANDADWTMEFVSEGCLELTGYASRALVLNAEVSYASLIVPEDQDAVWDAVQEAVAERRPFVIAYRIRTASGGLKWIWEKGRGVYSEAGDLLALEGFVSDITERRRLEERAFQAHRLESLGVLAGGIAHDFNNLLTAILGNVTMARSDAVNDKQIARLEKAERACIQASELTKRLLTFATGGSPITQPVSIVTLVQDCLALALAGSNTRAAFDVPVDPCTAQVDADQISQVLNNLFINSVQAMTSGGLLDIRVSMLERAGGDGILETGSYVSIQVHDHGLGISEADLARVCEPFFTTKPGASGLGLATAYRIVRAHGGDLSITSEEGSETTVQVLLPAARVPAAPVVVHEEAPSTGRGRVLVMDDEELILDVLTTMVQSFGYEVVTARNGTEAVQRYRESIEAGAPIDVVVLDLTVPGGMGGKEALAWLRDIDPQVRALVSSGYSSDPVMADPASYGFQAVIPKPYRAQQLASALHFALRDE